MNGGLPVEGAPTPGVRVERDPEKLVETLVGKELGELTSAAKMPGLGAAALAMARVLDDPTSVPQHPGAAGQLLRLMVVIRNHGKRDAKPTRERSGMAERRGELHSLPSA
ncbi:MAG: hypothetical protein ABI047_03250 [Jatrophihabitantaceae bacterium]